MVEEFLSGRVILHSGDCLEVIKTLADNSIDSVVTDPPYALTSIVKRFGKTSQSDDTQTSDRTRNGADGYARLAKGFMGKAWDNGSVAFSASFWQEVLRVLKPGGHCVAFGGTRSYHRLACAIEDAGFEIRDQLAYCYGTGFPKSHNVSKAVDRHLGIDRPVVRVDASLARNQKVTGGGKDNTIGGGRPFIEIARERGFHEAISDEAIGLHGWETALKPAWESLCLANKPLEFWGEYGTIGSRIDELEALLWSVVPANIAERLSASSHLVSRADLFASVQLNAEALSNIRAALSEAMDMSRFESALISSLNTVSSWNVVWAEGSRPENMSITETELSTTIGLRTLKSFLSRITPESIIMAHKTGQLNANASPAEGAFNASAHRLRSTLELSALAVAILQEADASLDAGARPLWEPICMVRKPLSEATIAANALRWGTGAINVGKCRVESMEDQRHPSSGGENGLAGTATFRIRARTIEEQTINNRWPANLLHDGSPEVLAMFPDTKSGALLPHHRKRGGGLNGSSTFAIRDRTGEVSAFYADEGSAARFFYSAKADSDDRLTSKHPTVKPVDLIQWLCRLITPPNGTILDPFAGSGTTGAAAWREGFNAVLIEREEEYQKDIAQRMKLETEGPTIRRHESTKARGRPTKNTMPLFD